MQSSKLKNKIKNFLKQHSDILIFNAHKCKKTIILSKQIYHDMDTYTKFNNDPTTTIQSKLNCILFEWKIINFLNTNGDTFLKT